MRSMAGNDKRLPGIDARAHRRAASSDGCRLRAHCYCAKVVAQPCQHTSTKLHKAAHENSHYRPTHRRLVSCERNAMTSNASGLTKCRTN